MVACGSAVYEHKSLFVCMSQLYGPTVNVVIVMIIPMIMKTMAKVHMQGKGKAQSSINGWDWGRGKGNARVVSYGEKEGEAN